MVIVRTKKLIPAVPERTYTEPARAEREEITETRVCDLCGKPRTRSRSVTTCMCCGRDVCRSCSVTDPECHGDYPDRLCGHCLTLHNAKYKTLLHKLEEAYCDNEANIRTDWKTESLAAEAKGGE